MMYYCCKSLGYKKVRFSADDLEPLRELPVLEVCSDYLNVNTIDEIASMLAGFQVRMLHLVKRDFFSFTTSDVVAMRQQMPHTTVTVTDHSGAGYNSAEDEGDGPVVFENLIIQ